MNGFVKQQVVWRLESTLKYLIDMEKRLVELLARRSWTRKRRSLIVPITLHTTRRTSPYFVQPIDISTFPATNERIAARGK